MIPYLLFDLPRLSARSSPASSALEANDETMSYGEFWQACQQMASGLLALGLARQARVAVYIEKTIPAVVTIFGASLAGAVFVPVNPVLKPNQVAHILKDCDVSVLMTTSTRLWSLQPFLEDCPSLRTVVLTGPVETAGNIPVPVVSYDQVLQSTESAPHRVIDTDIAAIFYTSGSTGLPKGVVLSHRNLVAGAASVASYLNNSSDDRILALLPISFDAGFSQITTSMLVGATLVLHNYLLPKDAVKLLAAKRITGLTAVPPLWIQLCSVPWPDIVDTHLRYFCNTGGAMPPSILSKIRSRVPAALPFLMYGLTEAFRSTYLPPSEVDRLPHSIGKAIPNAEILVLAKDGRVCEPMEHGELVHRGALVAMGYWNNPALTAERFKPIPGLHPEISGPELAVWSGDTVYRDHDGFLFFVGRTDDMIKCSGYRVSPEEVEDVAYRSALVAEAAALGLPHPNQGQGIALVAFALSGQAEDTVALRAAFKESLPAYMVPSHIEWIREPLPRNPNGKIDRKTLSNSRLKLFQAT